LCSIVLRSTCISGTVDELQTYTRHDVIHKWIAPQTRSTILALYKFVCMHMYVHVCMEVKAKG